MSNGADTDRFVKDPSMLVELCREVIDQLDIGSEDSAVAEQEEQLRVIAKAVEQLEKSALPFPTPCAPRRHASSRLSQSTQMQGRRSRNWPTSFRTSCGT